MRVGKESGNRTLIHPRHTTVGKMQMKLSVSGGSDLRKEKSSKTAGQAAPPCRENVST